MWEGGSDTVPEAPGDFESPGRGGTFQFLECRRVERYLAISSPVCCIPSMEIPKKQCIFICFPNPVCKCAIDGADMRDDVPQPYLINPEQARKWL